MHRGFRPSQPAARPGRRAHHGRFQRPDGALEHITDAIVAGELTVPISRIFELDEIREAVALQSSRSIHGKITVRM
ncbi:zinc-binding dehydrogenase [Oerskovia sp. M15]